MSRYLISQIESIWEKKESDDDDDREDAPNAVLLAMSVNSRRSGFVHFFTSRTESRTNSFRGAMAMSATSILVVVFLWRENWMSISLDSTLKTHHGIDIKNHHLLYDWTSPKPTTDGRTYDEEGNDDDEKGDDDDDESFEKTTTTRFVTLLRAAALRFCDVDVSLRGSGDDVLFGDV